MYKHIYLIDLSVQVENILTFIHQKRNEDMLIMSLIIRSMSVLELYFHARVYG